MIMAIKPDEGSHQNDAAIEGTYDEVLQTIIDYAYSDATFTESALDNARTALIDALGCAFEGLCESAELQRLVAPSPLSALASTNGARAPGLSHTTDLLRASFALGAMIRYLDHNDAFPGAEWGHPSDNIGSILPLADLLDRSSHAVPMREVLHAMIKAYEIQGVFQIKNAFNRVGLDHTILVKVASTAVACALLGLTRLQGLSAVSHAWMDGHALRAFRQYPNTSPRKGWAAGDACMRAVMLAQVAASGQPGAPTILTQPKWGFYNTLFGGKEFELPVPFGDWVMNNVVFKVNTAEGHALTATEAAVKVAQEIRARGLVVERDVRHVEIRTQEAAMRIIDKSGPLHNAADRDHCMRYIVAVILLGGQMVQTPDYQNDGPWANDPRVDELRAKMSMYEDPKMTAAYHDPAIRSVSNGIKVQLVDGSWLDEVVVEYPIGHPKRADTQGAVRAKARINLARKLAVEDADMVVDLLEDREKFDAMRVADFVDLLKVPSA